MFECCSCSYVFDQSQQSYKGIRIIGTQVICPACKKQLIVSKEEVNEMDERVDNYGFIVCLLFLAGLCYFKFVEAPVLPEWVLIPLVILFFIFAFWSKYNDLKGLKQASKPLKTELCKR